MKIRLINGPNLNLLGIRQPDIYGTMRYPELVVALRDYATKYGLKLEIMQTNHEGQIIDWIQQYEQYDALIINPAAYCHTSIAILDALLSVTKPKVEVHLTDISQRQAFRSKSITAKGVNQLFMGNKIKSYYQAIDYLMRRKD